MLCIWSSEPAAAKKTAVVAAARPPPMGVAVGVQVVGAAVEAWSPT
jgi:hypothetical protein